MTTSTALSESDETVLSILARRVRLLTVEQVARLYGHAEPPKTARRLSQLVDAGFLHRERLLARGLAPASEPLVTWQAGLDEPAFEPVVRTCQTRHPGPAILTDCVFASEATRARFACREGRPSRMSEVTHDLQLAAVYLQMRRELPTRARSWTSEDTFRRGQKARGEKLPDAVVKDGLYRTAIEVVGSSYRTEKLAAFHAYCAAEHFGYELW